LVIVSSTPDGGTLSAQELPAAEVQARLAEEELHDGGELPADEADGDPAGYLKYMPVVTFGLRVAALAGLAITFGVGEAVGLSGIFDAPNGGGAGGTTCCHTLVPS
jgi:hypothetical protein